MQLYFTNERKILLKSPTTDEKLENPITSAMKYGSNVPEAKFFIFGAMKLDEFDIQIKQHIN